MLCVNTIFISLTTSRPFALLLAHLYAQVRTKALHLARHLVTLNMSYMEAVREGGEDGAGGLLLTIVHLPTRCAFFCFPFKSVVFYFVLCIQRRT